MRIAMQFSVFLENKPGRLLQVCAALAKEKISIDALAVVDNKETSVLRFVADKPMAAREALKKLGAPFSETEVVAVELKHQAGALAKVCERLAAEHVNIDYIYSSAGAKNGRTWAMVKGTPLDKVKAALSDNKPVRPARLPARPRNPKRSRVS